MGNYVFSSRSIDVEAPIPNGTFASGRVLGDKDRWFDILPFIPIND